ncbi:MAG: RNA polymerase sigma-54 factor, partial [Bacillota bacterium]|nr:RNA polymerase sigma-54 factor [Bacillota bacterium]
KQAEWMLECIRRRESTLRQVVEIIIKRQRMFFTEQKGALSPLRMADVAAEAGLHVSTVSRAVKGKYLQCDRGLFPLHAFFSQALQGEGGTVSADSVKERLRRMIAEENGKKPFSDRELAEKLAAEGIRISRRTVAKYREAMGLASANGRRKYAADDLE